MIAVTKDDITKVNYINCESLDRCDTAELSRTMIFCVKYAVFICAIFCTRRVDIRDYLGHR